MKIDKKRITKFIGSAALMTALTLGGIITINEYTVNHNDRICLLTKIIGPQHQVEKIDNDQDNIKNGIFAEYSEMYYEVPAEYTIHHKDMMGYKKISGHTAYDVSNDNQPYQVRDNVLTISPVTYFAPSIEIFQKNALVADSDMNDAILIKELKLK